MKFGYHISSPGLHYARWLKTLCDTLEKRVEWDIFNTLSNHETIRRDLRDLFSSIPSPLKDPVGASYLFLSITFHKYIFRPGQIHQNLMIVILTRYKKEFRISYLLRKPGANFSRFVETLRSLFWSSSIQYRIFLLFLNRY